MFLNKSQDCGHTFTTRIHHLGFGPSDLDLVSPSISQSLLLGSGDLVQGVTGFGQDHVSGPRHQTRNRRFIGQESVKVNLEVFQRHVSKILGQDIEKIGAGNIKTF